MKAEELDKKFDDGEDVLDFDLTTLKRPALETQSVSYLGGLLNKHHWIQVKTKYQLGKLIYGKVEFHAPFGVFGDIGDENAKGIIQQIPDFLDNGAMNPDMYPEISSTVGASVIGYTEDDRNQVWLSVKPSVLQKSLVKLRVPVVSQV
jgi:hypothetical protein